MLPMVSESLGLEGSVSVVGVSASLVSLRLAVVSCNAGIKSPIKA